MIHTGYTGRCPSSYKQNPGKEECATVAQCGGLVVYGGGGRVLPINRPLDGVESGGDSNMKRAGMLVVSLRGVNF